MTKKEFFEELIEILELEEENPAETDEFEIDSLNLLGLITFLDENFGIQKTAEELENVSSLKDIIDLVGEDNLS